MKLNTTHLLAFIWACVISFLLYLGLTSCSDLYHYKKAIKKGVQFVPTHDTITLTKVDSILINNEWVKVVTEYDTIIQYNTVYVPKTRFEIRHMAKRERDSMKHVENVLKLRNKILEDSLDGIKKIKQVEKKIVQSETKGKKFDSKGEWSRLVWAIAFGLVALIVLVLIINRAKNVNN